MKNFDHAQFFPLDGQHTNVDCVKCHVDKKFKGTPKECVGCHAEPKVHAGLFGADCASCHTTTAWTPARLTQHKFPLDHGGQGEIACAVCHVSKYTEYTCYGCHDHEPTRTAQQHAEQNLSAERLLECAKCHPSGLKEESHN